MLMGPSYATPMALDRAGVTLRDLTLIDMHEAFAAQALSNVKMFGSAQFAKEKLGRSEAIGEIDMDKFNVLGGSIAYGHPFAATGARMITQTLRELQRRGGGLSFEYCLCYWWPWSRNDFGGRIMTEQQSAFSLSYAESGVAWLKIDVPNEKMNTLQAQFGEQVSAVLEELKSKNDIKGMVVYSGKPDNFVAGADIRMLAACTTAEEAASH